MNKLSRKASASLYVLLIVLIPNIYSVVFVHGNRGHQYDVAGTVMWILIPIFAILLFIPELQRQKKFPKTNNTKGIIFAGAYTLMLLFCGAAVSGFVMFVITGPDSF